MRWFLYSVVLSCVVGGEKPPVGSPEAKWCQGRGQIGSEDTNGRDDKVLKKSIQVQETGRLRYPPGAGRAGGQLVGKRLVAGSWPT